MILIFLPALNFLKITKINIMTLKTIRIKVVFSQQIQIVFIRTFLLFAIVFAMKANANSQKENVSFDDKQNFTHEKVIQRHAP
jgi:hypothetical protein